MERLVKGIKPDSWRMFRSEASRHGLKVGEFLGYLVEEHTKLENKGKSWEHLASHNSVLDAEDAKKIKESIQAFEQEYNFE